MVAISSEEAESFLFSQDFDISVLLIFGANEGLVSDRLRLALTRSAIDVNDPFQLVRLDGNEVAADPTVLTNETDTVGLFGDTRAILINSGTADFTTALELTALGPRGNIKLFIRAGLLKKEVPIRRYCEKQKFAAAIECLPDQQSSLNQLVDICLKEAALSIDDDAKALLVNTLGSDRLVSKTEIRKLITFAYGSSSIARSDVELLMSDSSASAVELVVNYAFCGDTRNMEISWNRLKVTGTESSLVLGAALREAGSIHHVFSELERGGSLEFAQRRYFNSGFNRKPISAKYLNRWSLQKCVRAVDMLGESSRRARRETLLAQEIALRALWAIAYLVEN